MRITALLLLLLSSAPLLAHDDLVATPVSVDANGAVYGEQMPIEIAVDSIDTVAGDVTEHAGQPRAYSGRITEVCQKQGCWMVLAGDSVHARVFMNDHAFGVPKDAQGEAVVFGTLTEKQHSEEFVEHLAADGAQQPQPRELHIDATSVLIRPAT